MNGDAPRDEVTDVASFDSQATSTFEPVTSTVTSPSPWARPESLEGDPGQTTALPVPETAEPISMPPPMILAQGPQGPRGFMLGLLAVLLILAVLAVYVYVAWLGASTRSTVDGWLPWM